MTVSQLSRCSWINIISLNPTMSKNFLLVPTAFKQIGDYFQVLPSQKAQVSKNTQYELLMVLDGTVRTIRFNPSQTLFALSATNLPMENTTEANPPKLS